MMQCHTDIACETCVCPSVSFEVKSVVETLAADCAQIAFDVVMATEMTSQQPLQREHFVAHSTLELVVGRL